MRGEEVNGSAADGRVTIEEQKQVPHQAGTAEEALVGGRVEREIAGFERGGESLRLAERERYTVAGDRIDRARGVADERYTAMTNGVEAPHGGDGAARSGF